MEITNRPLWNYDGTQIVERWIIIRGRIWYFYFIISKRGINGHSKIFRRKWTWGIFPRERLAWFECYGFSPDDDDSFCRRE